MEAFERHSDWSAVETACDRVNALASELMGEKPFFVHPIYPDFCWCSHYGEYNSFEGYCYGCGEEQEPIVWSIHHWGRAGALSPEDRQYLEKIQQVIALVKAQEEEKVC